MEFRFQAARQLNIDDPFKTRTLKFMIKKMLVFMVVSGLLAGCATKQGFDRGALRQQLQGASIETTDDAIKAVLELKPQLTFPFRLGVYFLERPRYRRYGDGLQWEGKEKNLAWLEELRQEGMLAEVIPITSLTFTGAEKYAAPDAPSLKDIRLAAARHHADAVLIIDYEPAVDRYNNISAWLYLTIVAGFLIPGTHSDALVMVNGALWDVRSEYLYLTVEVEGEAQKIGPAFLLKDEDSIALAKQAALQLFHEEARQRLRNLYIHSEE